MWCPEKSCLSCSLCHCSGSRKDRAWGSVLSGTQHCQGIRWEHVLSPPPTPPHQRPLTPPTTLHSSPNQVWHNANSAVGGARSFIHRCGSRAVISSQTLSCLIREHAAVVTYSCYCCLWFYVFWHLTKSFFKWKAFEDPSGQLSGCYDWTCKPLHTKQWKKGAAVSQVTAKFRHQLQWNCDSVSWGHRQTIYWIEPDITGKFTSTARIAAVWFLLLPLKSWTGTATQS